jgi:hypothetical protein
LRCFPAVHALALDGSPEMRARAEERLAEFGQRVRVGALDLAAADWWPEMDGADAVISSLAVHHLSGEQKRHLFEAVAQRLSPRGALLIADLVEPQRAEARELFCATWDAAAQANATALRAPHAYEQFIARHWNYFRYPDRVDTPSSLFDQLCWINPPEGKAVDPNSVSVVAGPTGPPSPAELATAEAAGRDPTATCASTRPVDADVVPTHGDVIVSEGPGDEVLRGEDVVAHKPALTNWTIASREDWRGIDRQACAGQFVHRIVHTAWRRGLIQRGVQDESDRGNGPGRGNGRDDPGGAARAAGGDKRRHRSDSCVGIRPD